MIKQFTYRKPEGEVSNRFVWEVHPASDKMLAIDLSEFDEDERIYLSGELQNIFEVMKEEIKQLGLGHNYRYFKKDRIVS